MGLFKRRTILQIVSDTVRESSTFQRCCQRLENITLQGIDFITRQSNRLPGGMKELTGLTAIAQRDLSCLINKETQLKELRVNKENKRFIQCKSLVNKDSVRRENREGVEHIVIESKTLPDDIVMNNMLYPASEIEKSFSSLEGTLAPFGHPEKEGRFLSATDPYAIANFYVGAHNENVRREDGRVIIDKVINVQEAMKTERGKRLLDRISELEESDDPRPIHTSVGVYLEVEECKEPRTNALNQEYIEIARNMMFDHDAILLDEVGAAQPHQGVGMAVNGEKVTVQQVSVETCQMSHSDIHESLSDAIRKPPFSGDWVVEVYLDKFVFSSNEKYFEAPYSVVDGAAVIVGVPLEVEREVTFKPQTNAKGEAMLKEFKDMIVNALSAAGIEADGLTDEQLQAKFVELNDKEADKPEPETNAAIQGLLDQVNSLAKVVDSVNSKLNADSDAELESLAELVANAGDSGLEKDELKKLGLESLKKLAANHTVSYGIPAGDFKPNASQATKYEMPE